MSASNKLTKDNKIIELYNTPVGRDTMDKVLMQLGISNKVITNPIVSNIKLSTVMKLAEKKPKSAVTPKMIISFTINGRRQTLILESLLTIR